jgi:hypothetical protein
MFEWCRVPWKHGGSIVGVWPTGVGHPPWDKEHGMGRIIVANRHGHQVVEWIDTDTEEARQQVAVAERILQEAREHGCLVSKEVDGKHVLDKAPFDPKVKEYQIIAPIAGG